MSNKENKSLSESFLKAFGIKSHQVFGEHIIHEETERQALERKSRLLEQKLKAAKNGGFGDLRKLKEERDAVMYQLSILAEDELSEDKKALAAAGKELEAYARKNGCIDKNDFMKAVTMMKKGELFKLQKFIDELDTEPREKIISVVNSHMKEELVAEMKADGEDSESADAVTPAGGKADDKANKKTSAKMEKIKEGIEGAYDKAFDSKELAEKFAGAVGGIVREMSGKFYVFNKAALQEAASLELAKKVKDLDDETDEKQQEAEMDKVDPKQAKKKFKDRDDKDIDNDGDVDDSDEYLHKRRQAISKAVSKDKKETKEEVVSSNEKKSELDEGFKVGDKVKAKKGSQSSNQRHYETKVGTIVKDYKDGDFKVNFGGNDDAAIAGKNLVKESVELDEAKWEYKANTYMVGGNLRYDDKLEYKLSKADAEVLNKYMKQAKSDTERSKVWKMFWDSKETGDTPKGPEMAIAYAKKAIKEEVELDEAVNVKGIQKAIDDGKSMDAIMTMFANKRTTNTDEIRKVAKDYMWKKRMKKEEVELDEAKYEINHKTFSAAVQHAKAQVEKQGYTIDDDEWDRKVAMGPRKPGTGKTNRYTIDLMKGGKETRRKLQMQVYYDEGRYELNMYVS